eukprot:gene16614-22857_t
MLRQSNSQVLSYLRYASATLPAAQSGFAASFSTRTQPSDIPEGHMDSDLRDVACNIGLGRRRDLTMRQDLCLWKNDTKLSLADVMKGKRIILVGFPGGPVCTEKMLPGYVEMAEIMSTKGVDRIVAVTPAAPEVMDLLADRTGAFMRLLGLEMGTEAGPKCQRFAAIVEDGILVKLCIEDHPKDLKVSDASRLPIPCGLQFSGTRLTRGTSQLPPGAV